MSKNMKLLGIASLTALVVLLSAGTVSAKGSLNSSSYNGVTILATDVAEGQLTLSGINSTGKELKVMVKKDQDGSNARWYDVSGNFEISANVIFEDGIGDYTIYAMIREDASNFSYGPSLLVEDIAKVPASAEEIATNVDLKNTFITTTYYAPLSTKSQGSFTKASKDIDSEDSGIVELSKALTMNKKSDREKIQAIYTWVAENVTYDFDKYNNMQAGNYTDDYGSLVAFETREGVCYDFSTLLAALCRSAGIQAKVAKGYSVNVMGYHAWNEVFDSEANEWIILDATVESLKCHKSNSSSEFTIRAATEYSKTEEM